MPTTDPIADMLTRMRNAQRSRKGACRVPHSKMAVAIARILREEGYVGGVGVVGEGLKKEIEITFRGAKGELALRRVSRPGRRVYCGREELRSTHGTLEVAIVSTSKGLMTDRRAWKEGVGGEVICTVVPPPD